MVLPQGGRVDSRRFLKAPHIQLCGAFFLQFFQKFRTLEKMLVKSEIFV